MAIYPRVIYKITHNVTKRIYIGSSGKLKSRIQIHINALRSGRHTIEDMQRDFNTYGENYTVEVVGNINNMSEMWKEYELIKKYSSHIRGIGYNYKDNHGGLKKEVENVYPNLRAELARHNISLEQISNSLGITLTTASLKLRGKAPITVAEAQIIKKLIKTSLPLEILFSEEAIEV